MEEILKDLDATFRLISSVSVSGDAVDMIAAAKNHLRKVFAELKKMEEGKNVGSNDN